MRSLPWLGAAMLALRATAAGAQPPPAVERAQACLKDNAARVSRTDRSLESAAGFLVNYLCAEEVETASRFERNRDLIGLLSAASPGLKAVSVDPATGRLHVPPEPGKSPTDGLGAVNVLQSGFVPSVSPSLKALAARLILEARSGRRR